mgnify:CR=1 FL=1
MNLKLLSLSGIVYQGEISLITLPTTSGEITVLPHHRALISVIKEGTVRIEEIGGKENFYPARSGFLEVDQDSNVTILLD